MVIWELNVLVECPKILRIVFLSSSVNKTLNTVLMSLSCFSCIATEVVLDSNGSGEAAGQQRASPSVSGATKMATPFGSGGVEGEEEWQLKEDLMGAFEGALDVGGKRGDLRGIRVLKNDRVMGARAGGGPCFGNCEDDEGAEWVNVHSYPFHNIDLRPLKKTQSSFCCWSSDHLPGKAGQEDKGGRYRECCQL